MDRSVTNSSREQNLIADEGSRRGAWRLTARLAGARGLDGDEPRHDLGVADRQTGKGDRAIGAGRAGAARVQKEGCAASVDDGKVGVTEYDYISTDRFRIQVEVFEDMDHHDVDSADLQHLSRRQAPHSGSMIRVSSDGVNRGNLAQAIQDLGPTDVAGMEDEIDAGEGRQGLGPQEAVGVRDYADFEVTSRRCVGHPLRLLGREAVALPAHGLDNARATTLLELRTQVAEVDIQNARAGIEGQAPHHAEELLFREGPPGA